MRIFLFVINGLGIGSLPDYSKYEQEYFCTAQSLECINELATFSKLGLAKCCLEQSTISPIGYFFRGRMLTTNLTFEGGLNEILGNITFGDNVRIAENLITLAEKNGIKTCFCSSKKDSIAHSICDNDDEIFAIAHEFNEKDSLFVAELNDFAKYGLSGDKQNTCLAIKKYDDFLGRFIANMQYDDVLFVTGNFGVNPLKIGITREYNPIFVYSKLSTGNKNLRTVQGNNAIAMTIADLLDVYPNGESLINDKIRQKIQNYETVLANEIVASGMQKIVNFSNKFISKKTENIKELKGASKPKKSFVIRIKRDK